MTKPLKAMDLSELRHEKLRLEYFIEESKRKGNFVGVKQNTKTLRKVEELINKIIYKKAVN